MRTGTVALTWHQTLLFLSPNRRTLYVRYLFESMLIIFFKSFHLVKVVFSLQFCSSFLTLDIQAIPLLRFNWLCPLRCGFQVAQSKRNHACVHATGDNSDARTWPGYIVTFHLWYLVDWIGWLVERLKFFSIHRMKIDISFLPIFTGVLFRIS